MLVPALPIVIVAQYILQRPLSVFHVPPIVLLATKLPQTALPV
jgi:hypothetical protein